MALLLGIDLGTSYFKVGLFDETGAMHGLGRVAVGILSPAPGRSELPVAEFWRLLRQGLAEALAQAKARSDDIVGLSYSSQANSFLLLDANNEPITPLVIWSDQRAHPVEAAVVEFGRSEPFRRQTGLPGLSAGFAPVKWRWFQQNEPAVWKQAARVMTISDYLTFALTGESVGDASTAAFTGLYASGTRDWWPEALDFFAVPPARLSRPLSPGTPCGRTLSRARDLLGLRPGIFFAVGALDHHAAAIGSGLEGLADASISTGTVLAALKLVDRVEPLPGCFHGPHLADRFFRLAFDSAGAKQLEDYQRQSAPQLSLARLSDLAASVPPGLAPEAGATDDPDRRHGAAVRRLMERMSATHRVLLQRVQQAPPVRRIIATGGGARSDIWLQINADMLDATVIVTRCNEPACLGAAAFAAAAAGMHSSLRSALRAMVHPDRQFEPQPAVVATYRQAGPVS
jgi:xylulokinase